MRSGDEFATNGLNNYTSTDGVSMLDFVTAAQYNALTGGSNVLGPDEVLAYSGKGELGDQITLFGRTFRVREHLSGTPTVNDYAAWLVDDFLVVVPDESVMDWLYREQAEAFRDGNPSSFQYSIALNLDGTEEEKLTCAEAMREAIRRPVSYTRADANGNPETVTYYVSDLESRQAAAKDFYSVYGGFLFLGLFLGALFLMATVLIIYYKQVSEGYEDKERFEIMRKVGMSTAEVRMAIRSQVLTVFFLPLLMAMLHIAAAFKMITKLLAVLSLTNVPLFFACTVATVVIFGAGYSLVYALTARTYYKIVS
ncbi:hypothetical protein SDC9_130260 [bioreactor metagenome]|uniref:ABC3 transporter permease protein domain-containing protein n=1 Tax=bioreactor metagenome TaxID=1076179 RepID=A0A645D220_9ZZZZ